MLIFPKTHPLSDFRQNPKPVLKHIGDRQFKIAVYLTANRKDAAVVMSPQTFAKIDAELLKLSIDNGMYESDLEEFRIGKLSAEDLRKRLRPNPGALGIPVKEAFAMLNRKIARRKKQLAKKPRRAARKSP